MILYAVYESTRVVNLNCVLNMLIYGVVLCDYVCDTSRIRLASTSLLYSLTQ